MEHFNIERLGDLEKGIKQLLLENRCSFSDKDKVLLKDIIELVQVVKSNISLNLEPNPITLITLARLLLEFFNQLDF